MCYDGDFDDCSLFSVNVRRARKRHRCDEFRAFVLPGEDYARASWLGRDSGFDSSVRCAQCYFLCLAIETLICHDHGAIPWGGGFLREELDELGVLSSKRDAWEGNADFMWAGDLFDAARYRLLEQIQ